LPTRDAENVEFKEAGEHHKGKELATPIEEGSLVNLKMETRHINNDLVAVIVTVDYRSAIEKIGTETKSFEYTIESDDVNPRNYEANVFIGSYVGGCLDIVDWAVR
jgi:hypothetical protein